jgi:hypothetical protein
MMDNNDNKYEPMEMDHGNFMDIMDGFFRNFWEISATRLAI